ncbi:MAG: lysine--tRNA ligase [Pyrinomonadaceae bacterium]
MNNSFIEDNDQTRARREHLDALRELIGNVYPNKFARSQASGNEDTITAILEKFAALAPHTSGNERPAPEAVEQANAELNKTEVRLSGRIATPPRVMGKAAFVHLSDGVSRLQIYVRKADVRAVNNDTGATIDEPADAGWQLFNLLDHGDFIGVAGYLFITKTGELSVHVRELYFLAKALLPMPDKMHGISDPEIRQRQRYADLIAGSLKVKTEEEEQAEKDGKHKELSPRETFELRSKLIRELRRYLDDHGYLEVETPMLTPKATGAAAKPFKTHHNALDIDLFARIAPELYLKRLVVGGFEKVYELNRNFRNEGISTRHNPEFTMLEFYAAYMDVNGMMDFCEEMLRTVMLTLTNNMRITSREYDVDFEPLFRRFTMKQVIAKEWLQQYNEPDGEEFNVRSLDNPYYLNLLTRVFDALKKTFFVTDMTYHDKVTQAWSYARRIDSDPSLRLNELDEEVIARRVESIFSFVAEPSLYNPTFIYNFPKPISPLSKASPVDSSIAERFELFIAGMEVANGFSELNDPVEQEARFLEQQGQRERGDEEAMVLDEDYIRALRYGMPPAAGIGIGIDRLVMILAGKSSIRDVILFPHMRPERPAEDEAPPEQE